MPVIPVLHRDADLRTTIRRALPRRHVRMVSCRSFDRVEALFRTELVDAVVIDVRLDGPENAINLAADFPGIPVFGLSTFRPDDGRLVADCRDGGLSGLFVQGVDDAIVGEVLTKHSASQARKETLENAPALLRLTEPLQFSAWKEILDSVGRPTKTSDIANALGCTREYISREFAAGGAPNIKRVIDLVRAAWASDMLKNPGYSVRIVSEILQFSSPSHLAGCAKRVAGVAPTELAELGPKGVLMQFRRGRMRSRL